MQTKLFLDCRNLELFTTLFVHSRAMPDLDKIFSCRYKRIELNIFRGDIVMAETDAIAILCDSDFKLNSGAGRTVKTTGGPHFINSLNEEKRKQRGSRVISVPVTNGIRASLVLLAYVSGTDRNSLDQIYSAIIQKALDLRIESFSMPLLGAFLSSIDAASNFMWIGLEQFSSFGRLKKIQIVDTNDYHMRSLHKFIISKLRAQSQLSGSSDSSNTENHSDDSRTSSSTGNTDNEHSFRLVGSGTSQSPIELFNFVGTSSAGTRRNFRRNDSNGSTRNNHVPDPHISINITISNEQETEQSSDESITSSGGGSGDSNAHSSNEDVSDGDAEMDSDHSDATNSDIFTHETDDDSDAMDSDDEEQSDDSDTENRGSALTREQERKFWTVVPIEQLKTGDGNSQKSDKPSSSSATKSRSKPIASQRKLLLSQEKSQQMPSTSSMRHPNVCLDDSSMPCSICLSDMREDSDDVVVQLSLCSHLYHKECIKSAFAVKRQCPLCMLWYGECVGYQPANATMSVKQISGYVAGHRDAKGFHEITYHIPAGVQIDGHIRPGQPYSSSTRIAYLPNNVEGTHVLKLLQLAFTRRLIFSIGDSVTTGRKNVPVWNNIHHKTNKKGGPQNYGYPDPSYLSRVKEELTMVGVRSEQLN